MDFGDDFFSNVSDFLIDFTLNTDSYIMYVIWGLLFLGVFSIFWGFFLRVNKNIKTGELISRLFVSFALFYFLWLVMNLLNIDLTMA
ncbi:hypothetical protein NEF87_002835 [Candidatus Lokiarchaeum ossiferum]|uniref:Uncharacterized protein n=1 Tax=Candidatus Lokiarchaeum ossiferum TaxID=2951803 RepID=A0ABY6HT14_9ARCH|nr:hypothetical protein NEF87_002835 [Candidatus Lokiarchaeum sp. B-35]